MLMSLKSSSDTMNSSSGDSKSSSLKFCAFRRFVAGLELLRAPDFFPGGRPGPAHRSDLSAGAWTQAGTKTGVPSGGNRRRAAAGAQPRHSAAPLCVSDLDRDQTCNGRKKCSPWIQGSTCCSWRSAQTKRLEWHDKPTSSCHCRRSTACRQIHHSGACWSPADNSSRHLGGSCSRSRHRRHCHIAALGTPAALGTCRGTSALRLSLRPWRPGSCPMQAASNEVRKWQQRQYEAVPWRARWLPYAVICT